MGGNRQLVKKAILRDGHRQVTLYPMAVWNGVRTCEIRMTLSVLNTTAETIPPGGAMEPVGTADERGRVRVRKPTASNTLTVLVNGLTPIAANGIGAGGLPWASATPGIGSVSLGLDPATTGTGTSYGTQSGSWYFKAGNQGFRPVADRYLDLVQAIPSGTGGGGFGDDGPEFCTDTNGSGFVTAVKKVVTGADGALRCVPVPACCPVRYYCTSNDWLNLEVGECCEPPDHLAITRIVLVQFTAKTGPSTLHLPDAALLVYRAGSLTPALWTGSASGTWNLGDDIVTGGVEFECVSGTLKARWAVTGFTGGADVTAPCLLTASPLSLGTYTYTRTKTYSCGATVEETGTVVPTVQSWIEP